MMSSEGDTEADTAEAPALVKEHVGARGVVRRGVDRADARATRPYEGSGSRGVARDERILDPHEGDARTDRRRR